MLPLNISHTSSYSSSIITMALSCIVSEILVENSDFLIFFTGSSFKKNNSKKCCAGSKELDIKSNITIYSIRIITCINIHGIAILKKYNNF